MAGTDSSAGTYLRHARASRLAVDRWLAVDPRPASVEEKAEALQELTRVKAMIAAVEFRLIGASQDAARAAGHRDVAAWVAQETHADAGAARSAQHTARDLQSAPAVAAGLASGAISEPHAETILASLKKLPADTSPGLRAQAEERLVTHSASMSPKEVRKKGKSILDEVEPAGDRNQLGTTLASEAARAWALTSISLRDLHDGTTRIEGVIPSSLATRLKTCAEAYASPRALALAGRRAASASADGGARAGAGLTAADGTPGCGLDGGAGPGGGGGSEDLFGAVDGTHAGSTTAGVGGTAGAGAGAGAGVGVGAGAPSDAPVSYATRLGQAFCTLIENLDPNGLPQHGGTATTVIVTVDYQQLIDELGTAVLADDGSTISAGEARRLACGAGIIPAVLGGDSQVLDMGRRSRTFTSNQITALRARELTCQAVGCDMPSRWCEAHHLKWWSRGGPTDLENGILLCSHHHHRVHDPEYEHERLPDRRIRLQLTSAGQELAARAA